MHYRILTVKLVFCHLYDYDRPYAVRNTSLRTFVASVVLVRCSSASLERCVCDSSTVNGVLLRIRIAVVLC
jgi:hypothetical protein